MTDKPKYTHAEWVSKELYDLQNEISRHPDLKKKFAESGINDFNETIGFLAAEFNIMLDGDYTQDDLNRLYKILAEKLRERRSPIILTSGR